MSQARITTNFVETKTNMENVVITGATAGLGLETAKQLIGQGYFVYLGYRNEDKAQQILAQLKAEGLINCDILALDVTDEQSVQAAAQTLAGKTDQLSVLINNAGIPGDYAQAASQVSIDVVKQVYETNVYGVIRTAQAFLPLLRKAHNPRIVNVSSDLGSITRITDPASPYYDLQFAAYSSSKAALNAYTVMLAKELRNDGFKVNAINPGYTATAFNNYQGPKKVEDSAQVIVQYATIGPDGPTCKFFEAEGEIAW